VGGCSPVKLLQALAADRRAIIVAAAAMLPEMTDHVRSLRASFLGPAVKRLSLGSCRSLHTTGARTPAVLHRLEAG
jgi:hypothetical protein